MADGIKASAGEHYEGARRCFAKAAELERTARQLRVHGMTLQRRGDALEQAQPAGALRLVGLGRGR